MNSALPLLKSILPASRRAAISLTLLALLGVVEPGRAANKFWNGGTGNWNTSSNWDPAGVPVNGDDLFFPTLAVGGFTTTTNNIPPLARRFRTLNFTAGGYVVRGNAIVVSNGVASVSGVGANTLGVDVTLAGNQTFANSTPFFTISSNINLAGFNLTLDASDAGEFLILSGAISGAGNLTKIGAGFLNFSGPVANTYAGILSINAGELRLDKTDGLTAVTSDLTVAAGATVRWFKDNQVADGGEVTVGGGGSLVLNNHDETLGPLDLTGTTITTGSGLLTMNGNLTNRASAASTTISGNLHLGNFTRTLGVAAGSAVDELVLSATLTGGSRLVPPLNFLVYAGLSKEGDGRLVLSGTNTYGGGFSANDGLTRVESDGAFGITPPFGFGGGVAINPAGQITLSSANISDHALSVNRPPPSAALTASGVSSWSGPVTLNTNALFTTGGTLAFSNSISGVGGLSLSGGTIRYAGTNANSYLGDTILLNGTLQLAQFSTGDSIPNGSLQIGDGAGVDTVVLLENNQLGTSVDIRISASGVLNLNNFSDFTGNLILEGGTVNTGAGTITPDNITVIATNVPASITGILSLSGTRTWTVHEGVSLPDLSVSAQIIGSGSLIKNGDGLLNLNSPNLYTGTTTINGGTVSIANDTSLGPVPSQGTIVNNGGTLLLPVTLNTLLEPLTLSGGGYGGVNGALRGAASATTTIATNIVLAGDTTIFVDTSGGVTINGSVSGPGDLTKNGAGTLTLAGSSGNTFAGDLFDREGTVNLSKTSGSAVPNNLSIGLNGLIIGGITARVNHFAGSQIGGAVTVNGTGTYDVNSFIESIGGLHLNDGGNVIIDAGGLLELFTGLLTTSSGFFGGTASISGAGEFSVGTGSRTLDVPEGGGPAIFDANDLVISAHLIGSANITKTSGGDVFLTASNSFAGSLVIQGGEVRISHAHALGTTVGATRVNGDALLSLSGTIVVAGESLTLDSTGQPDLMLAIPWPTGALESTGGTNTWTGPISLTQTAVINVETNSALTLTGVMNAGGGVTKAGPGRLEYAGTAINTYSGVTTVNAGSLVLSRTGGDGRSIPGTLIVGDGTGGLNADLVDIVGTEAQLNNSAAVTVNSSGLFRLSIPLSEIIGSLAGTGRVQLNGTGLFTGGNNASTAFDGVISGTGALTKSGTGLFTLNGNNNYSGLTTVAVGTLLVNGSQTGSDVAVNNAATLGGDGRIGELDVNNLGNLAPGASPGSLSAQNTKLDPGSNFRVELNGASPGSGYDQLSVTGPLDLNGAQLLTTKGPGYAPAEGAVHVIISNDGADAVVGAFGGRPEGSLVTLNSIDFRLSYLGGTGNDVTLTVTNLGLRFASARVAQGNGNGVVDPNECDHLFIALENRTGATISGLTTRLDSLTPGVVVTQPDSAYPNIPALSFRTNAAPFQIRVRPDYPCGQNIQFSLVVTAPGEGTFAVPFTMPSGGVGAFTTFASTDVPRAIPDLSSTNSTIDVTGSFFVGKVRVTLHATHPAAGDLRFRLRSSSGTEVMLAANRGGNVANYGNSCAARTTFDDAAATKIAAASAPFNGTFAPDGNLSAFIGEGSFGTWTLVAEDSVGGDIGALQCWSLQLASTTCTDGGGECESCLATVAGTLTPVSPTLPERIFRTSGASGCGHSKPCPGGTTTSSVPPYRYNTHAFTNTGPDTCVTVVLNVPCTSSTSGLLSAAYLNQFLPPDLCANYLGDSGTSIEGGSGGYSFRVAAGERFEVMVHELNPSAVNQGCGNYTLQLYGLPCPPPVLHIAHDAGPDQVRLFWSTAYPEFQLQVAPNVDGLPPFPFSSVPTIPTVLGGHYHVTNGATANDDYFRLRKP